MLKPILKVTASSLIAVPLFYPMYSFDGIKNKVVDVSYATPNQNSASHKVVEEMIKGFINKTEYLSEWKDANVQFKYELHDIDDSLLGYYLEVKKGNEVLGYFITSATFVSLF